MKFLILLFLFNPISFAQDRNIVLQWPLWFCSHKQDLTICLSPKDFTEEEFCPALYEDRPANIRKKPWMSEYIELVFPTSECEIISNSAGSIVVCDTTKEYLLHFCR